MALWLRWRASSGITTRRSRTTCKSSGGLQGGAWQLLSTLFTDVTTADEWLKLFDHIVAVGREMLPHLAAAFLVIWRDTILAAPEGSTAIKQLFARDAGTSLPDC